MTKANLVSLIRNEGSLIVARTAIRLVHVPSSEAAMVGFPALDQYKQYAI